MLDKENTVDHSLEVHLQQIKVLAVDLRSS